MAKKLIAVTAIRHNSEDMEAGAEVDTSKFTKEELKSLYDSGAVRVDDDGKADGPNMSVSSPENPEGSQDAQQVGDVSAAQKKAQSTTPSTSPTKK